MSAAKILVVDDEERVREMLKFRLKFLDYEVIEATNGRDALEVAAAEKPDLILLDVMMPEIDGFQACTRLKENEDTRQIPVVMLTARADAKDVARSFTCGAEDYMVKPYDPEVLQQKVASNLPKTIKY